VVYSSLTAKTKCIIVCGFEFEALTSNSKHLISRTRRFDTSLYCN